MEISSDTGIRYLRKFRECLEKLVVFVEENFICKSEICRFYLK